MDNAGPSFDERVLDVTEEGGVGVKIGKSYSFQFETLAGKVRINELLDLTTGRVGSVDGCGEICEDLTGRFVCWLVDECLRVWV